MNTVRSLVATLAPNMDCKSVPSWWGRHRAHDYDNDDDNDECGFWIQIMGLLECDNVKNENMKELVHGEFKKVRRPKSKLNGRKIIRAISAYAVSAERSTASIAE